MKLMDFNRTVPYIRRKGIIGYFQLIYHNSFDLILLNIIFIFTSLPIITIGASYCAFISVCNKYAEDKTVYPVKEYFFNFKKYLLKGSLYGLLFLITVYIISYSCLFYLSFGKENFVFYFFSLISLIGLIIITIIIGYFFPIFTKTNMGFKQMIVNSFILSFNKISGTFAFLGIITVCIFLVLSFFPYSIPFIAVFPVFLIALCSSCISAEQINESFSNTNDNEPN